MSAIESLANFNVSSLNKTQVLSKTKELQKALQDYVQNKEIPSTDILLCLERVEKQTSLNNESIRNMKNENTGLRK